MPGSKNTMLALNKQCIAIIQSNKKLLVFPVINYILTLCLFLIIITPLSKIEIAAWKTNIVSFKTYFIAVGIMLGYFTLLHLINTIFTAALTQCAINHIEKKPYTIRTGFHAIAKNALHLVSWKFTMTTIGPIIRFMEFWEDNWSTTSTIAANLLATLPWMTGTLFVIPVLITENCGSFRSIKRSSQLILKRFGEKAKFQCRINFKLGLIRILAFLPLIITLAIGGKSDMIVAAAFGMFIFLSVSMIQTAVQIILISALYLYAVDADTSAYFDVDLLKNAL